MSKLKSMKKKYLTLILLVLIYAVINTFYRVNAEPVLDYRNVTLSYSASGIPITKPVADLVATVGGESVSDGGYTTADQYDVLFLDASGSMPMSAPSIDDWDFQYSSPTGFYRLSYVPEYIILDNPGKWVFYLCVKGSIPESLISGNYSDWSDNGSHSVIGKFNMLWHFVVITVEVKPKIYHTGSISASITASPDNPYIRILPRVACDTTIQVSLDASSSSAILDGNPVTIDTFEFWCGQEPFFEEPPALSGVSSVVNIPVNITIPSSYYLNTVKLYAKTRIYCSALQDAGIKTYISEAIIEIVIPIRYRPVANIVSSAVVSAGAWFNVSSAGSYAPDPDCRIVDYGWSVQSQYEGLLSADTGEGSIRFNTPGEYAVTLIVTDNLGESSLPYTHTVNVISSTPENSPPVAVITGPSKAVTGKSVEFSGAMSYDPDYGDSIADYSWCCPIASTQSTNGRYFYVEFPSEGIYTISLTVSDTLGLSSTAFSIITIEDPIQENTPPVAVLDVAEQAYVGDMIELSGLRSYDPDIGDYITTWQWSADNISDIPGESQVTISYLSPGNYTIYLTVIDKYGLEGYAAKTIRILETVSEPTNKPPSIHFEPFSLDWYNRPFMVKVIATDHEDGIRNLYYGCSEELPAEVIYRLNESAAYADLRKEGIWYVTSYATDHAGNTCPEVIGGPYKLDFTPPTLVAEPNTSFVNYKGPLSVTLISDDTGGSGIYSTCYRWSLLCSCPSVWEEHFTDRVEAKINQTGNFYLHAKTRDNAGNETYYIYGPYYVTETIPSLSATAEIKGSWNLWGESAPHRFLSLELIKINIKTTGYADKAVIRFSPELENMQFTDIKGYEYNYSEFTNYEVCFPDDSTCWLNPENESSYIYWEYVLPLAPSTISSENIRLRFPYQMQIEIWRGSESHIVTVDDIDITGNIYDYIHIQPK